MATDEDQDRLTALAAALERARTLARRLEADPLLARLVDVFARMPEGDREVVIGALEREVRTRLVSQEVAATLTRVELRPNPNARLYLRVVDRESEDPVETTAFLRTAYSVQRTVDALDPNWRTMVASALRHMSPEQLERLDAFNREIRALLDEAARAESESAPTPGGPPATTSAPSAARK